MCTCGVPLRYACKSHMVTLSVKSYQILRNLLILRYLTARLQEPVTRVARYRDKYFCSKPIKQLKENLNHLTKLTFRPQQYNKHCKTVIQ